MDRPRASSGGSKDDDVHHLSSSADAPSIERTLSAASQSGSVEDVAKLKQASQELEQRLRVRRAPLEWPDKHALCVAG